MVGIQEIGTGSLGSRPEPPITFNNIPNQLHHGVYISRSVAVIVLPVFVCDGDVWIPLGLRSNKVSDSGMESLICGYLDYNETLSECAIRESWEELGLDLSQWLIKAKPYDIMSDPTQDARQNIGARFRCFTAVETLPELFPCDEVVSARWVKVEEAVKLPLAFQHDRLIAESLDWISMMCQIGLAFEKPKKTPDEHIFA